MASLLAFASAFVFGMKGFGLSNEKVHLLSFSVEFRHFFSGRDFCGSGEVAELPFFTIENTKSQFFWEGGGDVPPGPPPEFSTAFIDYKLICLNISLLLENEAEVITNPFTCCVLPDFIQPDGYLKELRDELTQLDMERKVSDLYQFFQVC